MPLVSDGQELAAAREAADPHALPGMPDCRPHVAFPRSWLLQMLIQCPCSVVPDSHSSCFRLQQTPSVKVPIRQKPKRKLGVVF